MVFLLGGCVNVVFGKGKVCDVKMEEDREVFDFVVDWVDISQGLCKDLGQ